MRLAPLALPLLGALPALTGCFDDGFQTCCFEGEFEGSTEAEDVKEVNLHVDPAAAFIQRFRIGADVSSGFLSGGSYTLEVLSSDDVVYAGIDDEPEDLNRFSFSDASAGFAFAIDADPDFDGVFNDAFIGVAPSFSSSVPSDIELRITVQAFQFSTDAFVVTLRDLEPLPPAEL